MTVILSKAKDLLLLFVALKGHDFNRAENTTRK
jgi:hypothetical protein